MHYVYVRFTAFGCSLPYHIPGTADVLVKKQSYYGFVA